MGTLTIPEPVAGEDMSPLFWIEEYDAGISKSGEAHRHVPGSRMVLDVGDAGRLRSSGLLNTLGENGAYSLLALTSFLTTNGGLRPSISEIAQALGTSERHEREQFLQLQKTMWNGLPLLREVARDARTGTSAGSDYYILSPRIVGFRMAKHLPTSIAPPISSREAVLSWSRTQLSWSRTQYATPRAEAERLVDDQLGTKYKQATVTSLFDRLVHAGVAPLYAERLIVTESEEEIEKQLKWLPERNAKEPSRFLVAAVRGKYSSP